MLEFIGTVYLAYFTIGLGFAVFSEVRAAIQTRVFMWSDLDEFSINLVQWPARAYTLFRDRNAPDDNVSSSESQTDGEPE